MSEKRIDPDDGVAYTFAELAAYYKGKYQKKAISEYWESTCTPLKGRNGKRNKGSAQEPKAKAKTASKGKKTNDKVPHPKTTPEEIAAVIAQTVASTGLRCYPRGSKPELGYGTAGFRTKAEVLDHVMYRVGVLAALRSLSLGGRAIGVMVTASHNPECDNGVKLVDPLGDMLPISWEGHATKLANAADSELAAVFVDLAKEVGAFKKGTKARALVIFGRDTRQSSPSLTLAAVDGVGAVQPSSSWSLGEVSTPQLHYAVRCHNTRSSYGKPNVTGYCDKLVNAYTKFLETIKAKDGERKSYKASVAVDCANGVGFKVMQETKEALEKSLSVKLVNTGDGVLNKGCGADFVKTSQTFPQGLEKLPAGMERGGVFDGDADRLVYFCAPNGKFALLDGDRIATLLASFISAQLELCKITSLRLGIVQTAYANGASTAHVAKQIAKENIVCAKTGVKHLHHEAKEMDVGVYFEANGHGTVIFSKKFVTSVRKAAEVPETKAPAELLLLLRDIVNETVGDAFSDFLAVEAVLYARDINAEDWLKEYDDLPNKQAKVSVKDRGVFETTNAERTCVKPEGLQAKIDELVAAAGANARSFVRPSGTEDVVRVYAEAATQQVMEDLAKKVSQAVYDLAGGVGQRP